MKKLTLTALRLALALARFRTEQRSRQWLLLLVCVIASVGLRFLFIQRIAFTNDEGAYLYDAKAVVAAQLPAGDALTKAPVPILAFAASYLLTNGSLFASRAVALLASLAATVPLIYLTDRFRHKTPLFLIGIVWLLGSGSITLHSLGHTESLAALFSLSALAVWWYALSSPRHSHWAARAAGGLLVMAIASRKVMIALLPALCWLLWRTSLSSTVKWKCMIGLGVGAILFLLVWVGALYHFYGIGGIQEGTGIGYGAIVLQHLGGEERLSWAGAKMPHMLSWLRLNTPVIVLGLLSMAVLGAQVTGLWRLTISPLAAAAGCWLGALAVLYGLWPTFLVDYGADFLPAITLGGVSLLSTAWHLYPRFWQGAVLGVLMLSSSLSLWHGYRQPWTGMFTPEAVATAAATLRSTVPHHEPILTAAVIVPYLSGHKLLGNITHPLWYRYRFIDPATKEIFLPDQAAIEEKVNTKKVRYVLNDHLTDYSYLRSKADLFAVITNQWELIATIPNDTGFRSNPLTLWRAP